jgi:dethiobiotin synthetase
VALRATPIIVCPNRLGAVNQVLLTVHALPRRTAWHARVVLMSPPKPDNSTRTNVSLLAKFLGAGKIFSLPWLGHRFDAAQVMKNSRLWWMLHALVQT